MEIQSGNGSDTTMQGGQGVVVDIKPDCASWPPASAWHGTRDKFGLPECSGLRIHLTSELATLLLEASELVRRRPRTTVVVGVDNAQSLEFGTWVGEGVRSILILLPDNTPEVVNFSNDGHFEVKIYAIGAIDDACDYQFAGAPELEITLDVIVYRKDGGRGAASADLAPESVQAVLAAAQQLHYLLPSMEPPSDLSPVKFDL